MEEEERSQEEEGGEDFAAMLEQSIAGGAPLEAGQKVEGTVLKAGPEWTFLDVGQKGEGVLATKELLDEEGRLTAAVGDRVSAYFLGREGGELRFTTRLGGGTGGSAALETAWQNGIPVEGKLEQETKGGFEVRLTGGARAFCPFSQLGTQRHENPEELAGRTLSFRITKFGGDGRDIVVSHRAILEEERRRQREVLKENLREGAIVKGTVTAIRDFGAFVDIGGIEGLLPIAEVGWGRTNDLTEVLSVGQVVEVAVKSLDWEEDRFSFSLRATTADPWSKVGTVYTEGSVHNGTVARLLPFGAFVTLEDGVDGLLHISKIGEGRHINHPREVLKEGQPLKVTVDKIDASKRRISLAPAAKGDEEAATADYLGRPQASMGSFGDLLKKAAVDKKKKG
jgi:small subunit ribosomal protein S1